MTWIEEYRKSIGMSRTRFAVAITRQLGERGGEALTVPPTLIYRLECWPNCRTHPKLMDLIARACGATKEQRDQFLHPSRRDYPYRQSAAALTAVTIPHPWRTAPAATTDAARAGNRRYVVKNGRVSEVRPVVVIDKGGSVVFRGESAAAAEAFSGMSAKTVLYHCHRMAKVQFIRGTPYIFRFAEEWDAMSPSARARDVGDALESSRVKGPAMENKRVVVLDRAGRERTRYDSIKQAARGEVVSEYMINSRCRRRVRDEFKGDADTTYRFAAEWDAMNPAQRTKDLSAAR